MSQRGFLTHLTLGSHDLGGSLRLNFAGRGIKIHVHLVSEIDELRLIRFDPQYSPAD